MNELGIVATWEARACFGMAQSDFGTRAAMAKQVNQLGIARMYEKALAGENLAGLGINSGTGIELTALIASLAGKFFAPAIVSQSISLPPRSVAGVFTPGGIVAEEKLETLQSAPILLKNGIVQVTPSMCVAILCFTQEFLSLRNAPALIQREIEMAIGRGLDRIFAARLMPGSAGGFTATSSALADLRTLTADIVSLNGQQLLLAASIDVAQRLAFLAPGGIEVFPLMPAIGVGEIKGLQVFPSDQLSPGTMLGVDPSGLASSIDEITVEASPGAALNMDDSAQMPSALTSMFQSNSVALRISARFTCTILRDEDVSSSISDCSWTEA